MLNFLSSWGQNKNEDKFITWEQFTQNFGKEMVSAQDVFNNMQKSGVSDFSLAKFDFHFVSNSKDKLEKLQEFLNEHYPYEIKSIKKIKKGLWELNGETNEIPITEDNLLYWGLDMYKRGYEFDASVGQEGDYFLGLALDEDNQPELTEERLGKWLPEVIKDFGLEINL